MTDHIVTFIDADNETTSVSVASGTLVADAAIQAGMDIGQPCGGQGRCGRCAVQVTNGNIRRRSTLRLSPEDIQNGYALACQSVIESNVDIFIPTQEVIERHITTDRVAAEVKVPEDYDFNWSQTIRRYNVQLIPPSMDDQTDDWSRLQTALRLQHRLDNVSCTINLLKHLGDELREGNWQATVVVNREMLDETSFINKVIDVKPGLTDEDDPLWATAIDIGTTTVSLWLVDLVTGQVKAQTAEYNGQIVRGEDVISRIIYASKDNGSVELQQLVVSTINKLCETACKRVNTKPVDVMAAVVAGNSTMIHLLLGIPASSIRLSPFITTVNQPPRTIASHVGFNIAPDAVIDCLPGVASYVGADITAGILSSGVDQTDKITLFIDIGTNGEIVLGNRDWLVTCACSAGPAFEGAGVVNGMRATNGAIEEVWVNNITYEPSYRVIGNKKPVGLCGSGLISLISEMFLASILDKAGNINLSLPTNRVRDGEHGSEYVIAWANETEHGKDIVLTHVDVDNLLRAKAAIYAGFSVLAEQVGMTLDNVQQMFIGGSFGKYINVEKAIQIGLLPDMPWEKFEFLGNTSIKGAYLTLLETSQRERINDIAKRMTYIELSTDNTFYEAFTSALFLPHTDIAKFPSVEAALVKS